MLGIESQQHDIGLEGVQRQRKGRPAHDDTCRNRLQRHRARIRAGAPPSGSPEPGESASMNREAPASWGASASGQRVNHRRIAGRSYPASRSAESRSRCSPEPQSGARLRGPGACGLPGARRSNQVVVAAKTGSFFGVARFWSEEWRNKIPIKWYLKALQEESPLLCAWRRRPGVFLHSTSRDRLVYQIGLPYLKSGFRVFIRKLLDNRLRRSLEIMREEGHRITIDDLVSELGGNRARVSP